MIVTFEHGGRFSAATAAGILFYGASRVEAERALANANIDPAALDNPADGLTWRSTLTSAFANEILAISAAVDALPVEAAAQVAAINERLDVLTEQQAEERRRAETRIAIGELEHNLREQFALWRRLLSTREYSDVEVQMLIDGSPMAHKVRELRQQL